MEHYYSENPTSELVIKKLHDRQLDIDFYTASGLFSKDHIDKGSRLLIKKANIKPGQKILDLGCGYGIVGIVIKKKNDVLIEFSDINSRAVSVTKKNLELHKIKAKVYHCDGFEKIKSKYDIILLNPPQTAGKKVCQKLILDSKDHLNPNGSIQVVARHNKGGKSLSAFMEEIFGNVDEIAKGSGFRVYLSRLV
jgi:16S rRNA G1207 methylase RsmC